MKRKIVLIDIDCVMVNSLLKSEIISIETLIVGSDQQKKEVSDRYNIKNILSAESINTFYLQQNITLDYSLIDIFRATQLKVEHFFSRKTTDINSIQYIYYCALSYWVSYFSKNDIDMVFSSGIEFGSTFDTIIYDVANYNKKQVIIMEVALNNGSIIANQLYDYSNKKHLAINLIQNQLKPITIDDFLFNSQFNQKKNKKSSFKEKLMKTPEKYGGYLLIMFFSLILGKFKSIHHSFNTCYWTYFKNYIYSRKMLRYYNSISSELDKDSKYLYYSLHMEPEASTIVRTKFANQLVIIKALSQNLPKGWKLYVKEHPHQFKQLNNFTRYFYLASLEKFKTKRYYEEIIKLKNVELLHMDIQSKEVIENAQAIGTINGTIILEAIFYKKPILLFSQNTTPFENLEDIYYLENSRDILDAVNCVERKIGVKYANLVSLVEDYFFEVNQSVDYRELVEQIIKDRNE